MKRSDQAALIRRLEAEAERDPGALKRRVIGLGILGYAFFGDRVSRKALERLVAVPLEHPAYLGLNVSRAAASRFAAAHDSIVFSG